MCQVDLLARLLGNIFPLRNGRITPYHKTVVDWLLPSPDQPAHKFTVNADVGHALLASACCKLLLGSPLPMAVPPSQEQGVEEEQQEEGKMQCSPQVSREKGAVPPSGQ